MSFNDEMQCEEYYSHYDDMYERYAAEYREYTLTCVCGAKVVVRLIDCDEDRTFFCGDYSRHPEYAQYAPSQPVEDSDVPF